MAGRTWKSRWQAGVAAGGLALTGCSNFFVPVTKTVGGGGGGGGATTNLVYVANTGTNSISGFGIGTGLFTTIPGMPYAVGFTPQAEVVTIGNTFLYVAGPTGIYAYLIGTDGSLAPPAGGAQVIVANDVTAMDVSPDGNWLLALDGTLTQMYVYAINKATGGLTRTSTVPYAATNAQGRMVKVSAGGTLVFAALGSGGDVIFTFNTSTGAAILSTSFPAISSQTSDNALAVDSTTSYLYIARSGVGGGLAVYAIGSGGSLTSVTGSPFAAGAQPLAVVVDGSGKFAYVGNGNDGTVSGYTLSAGVATAISGQPYAAGASVQSLTFDKTATYLMAVSFAGSPDLTMFTFDRTVSGKLNKAATAATATGTVAPGSLIVTATH